MITRLPTRFGIALAMTAAVVLGGCSSDSSDTTLVSTNSVVPSAAATTDGVGTRSGSSARAIPSAVPTLPASISSEPRCRTGRRRLPPGRRFEKVAE